MPQRVVFFIDGFNLYHVLDSNAQLKQCRWLNLRKLAQRYCSKKDAVRVLYFTAYADWNRDKVGSPPVIGISE